MASDLVQVNFTIPREWRDELKVAADAQAISFSDLLRLIIRAFMRNRHDDAARELLEARR